MRFLVTAEQVGLVVDHPVWESACFAVHARRRPQSMQVVGLVWAGETGQIHDDAGVWMQRVDQLGWLGQVVPGINHLYLVELP